MNKIDTYKRNKIAGKDGFDMFLEIIEAVERGIKKGKQAIIDDDFLEQGRTLTLSTEILLELENRLPIVDGMENLRISMIRLFDYSREKILKGHQNRDLDSLDIALSTLAQMRLVSEKMKENPDFHKVRKEAHRNESSGDHSIARFTMQHSTVEESAEDMLVFLAGYQSMQEAQEKHLTIVAEPK